MSVITLNEQARLAFGCAIFTVAALVWRWKRTKHKLPLPPGPPLEPIIGIARSLPSTHQWIKFAEWSKMWGESFSLLPCHRLPQQRVGDVMYTPIFGKPIIVLNSIDSARDLLDKKGSNFSDRPRTVVYEEMYAA